jgi:transcriptional regulator with XRE-family HTH domain
MNNSENVQVTGTISNYVTQKVADEEQGKDFAQEYLKAAFLVSAVDALFDARRDAGLTQTQVADRLKTKQAAIARLEADTAGSMSLRRYVEFAFACGMAPLSIQLVPLDQLRQYLMDHPEASWTLEAYSAWIAAQEQPILTPETHLFSVNELASSLSSQ